jgi:hypothetical protein
MKSAPRVRRVVETAEYGQMVRRMVAAYARRVSDGPGDVEALTGLAELAADVDAAMADAVAALKASGHSWAEVARVLGTSRQAAQQRYGVKA